MDTTAEYIKMCDCLEVQGHMVEDENNIYINLGSPTSLEGVAKRGYPYNVILWLPRQDQIQEMLDGSWVITFESFDEWYFNKSYPGETYPNDVFKSMEQLWLAFYMYEKHDKVWTGKEWK